MYSFVAKLIADTDKHDRTCPDCSSSARRRSPECESRQWSLSALVASCHVTGNPDSCNMSRRTRHMALVAL